MPRLVEDTQLGRANAALSLGDQLPIVVSAILAGPVLVWAAPAAFGVPALMFVGLGLAWGLPRMPSRPQPAQPTTRSGPVRRPRLSASAVTLIGLSTIYFLVYGPFQPLLPELIQQNLGGGPAAYGAMRCVSGSVPSSGSA